MFCFAAGVGAGVVAGICGGAGRCLAPRVRFSAGDARFCAEFVRVIHSIGTPYFSSVMLFDDVVRVLFPTAPWITRGEAANFGVFMHDFWAMLTRWDSDEKIYMRECGSKPGMAVKFESPDGDKHPYALFRKLYRTWHVKIASTALKFVTVNEKQTHCTMNALTVLSKMLPIYPSTYKVFNILNIRCDALVKREKGPNGNSRTALGLLADQ